MKIDISKHIADYRSRVISQLDDLTSIGKLIPEFKSIDFRIDSFNEKALKSLDIENVVYVIQITDFGAKMNASLLCRKISDYKKKQKKTKYPKVNAKNAEILNNNILYIGKSSGLFLKRLEQHLNANSPKTYALHMKTWGKEFSNLKLKLFYTSIDANIFKDFKNFEAKDLLELIETSLHQKFQPLLGRSGH